MNIDIVLFAAWVALQPWRLGRMFFFSEKFSILIFLHLHPFSLRIHALHTHQWAWRWQKPPAKPFTCKDWTQTRRIIFVLYKFCVN